MSLVDLFIPTYNRPDFLKRILTYYNSYKFKPRIIIADSSTKANKKLNRRIVSSFANLDILYVDKFSDKQISHQKFGEMVKYAKARYSVFCADDDFLIPKGIDEAVKFLEKNPDYSSAHGTYIAFYIYNSLPNFKKFLWRFIYPFKSINDIKPIDRLTTHLKYYHQVLWAVRRTKDLKIAYSEFLKSKVDPILFGELLPDMLTLIYGKMKRINTFYSARQAFSTSYRYWPSLQDAIKNGTYDKEYAKFRNCLIRNINRISVISKSEGLNQIDQAMKEYLSLSNQEHLTGRMNLILGNAPLLIANLIRQLHIFYLHLKSNRDQIGQINKPTSAYYRDFANLKKSVMGE